MTFIRLMTAFLALSFTAACPGPFLNKAGFSDVSKRPPDAKPETIDALTNDRSFAEWVIYQDRACDAFGCIE
ncbi:MAG: hypothetical protein ACRBB0_26955 [Pelagimonas sp.]|uniref:hypothetical protein n=1 Tax=Pelagimonas sp. TaxID=2073170 RepID=UPI003D6A2AA1